MKTYLIALLMLVMTSCAGPGRSAAMQSRTETVDLDNAAVVHALIEVTAGDLAIDGGASHLLEADFRYNRPELDPTVSYRVSGSEGELIVSNRENGNEISGEIDGAWTLRFHQRVPLDLDIATALGDSYLDLGDLTVRRLALQPGIGSTTIDLRTVRQDELTVKIAGGLGPLTLILPEEAGVRVAVDQRSGNMKAKAFHMDPTAHGNATYVNDTYRNGSRSSRVFVEIQGGTGDITLREGKGSEKGSRYASGNWFAVMAFAAQIAQAVTANASSIEVRVWKIDRLK